MQVILEFDVNVDMEVSTLKVNERTLRAGTHRDPHAPLPALILRVRLPRCDYNRRQLCSWLHNSANFAFNCTAGLHTDRKALNHNLQLFSAREAKKRAHIHKFVAG